MWLWFRIIVWWQFLPAPNQLWWTPDELSKTLVYPCHLYFEKMCRVWCRETWFELVMIWAAQKPSATHHYMPHQNIRKSKIKRSASKEPQVKNQFRLKQSAMHTHVKTHLVFSDIFFTVAVLTDDASRSAPGLVFAVGCERVGCDNGERNSSICDWMRE